MNLETYDFPNVTDADIAFPTLNTTKELVAEAERRNPKKGIAKFNELFYRGGKIKLKADLKGTWKEKAWRYCQALMGSWSPKHEHKQAVCGMLIEECLEL